MSTRDDYVQAQGNVTTGKVGLRINGAIGDNLARAVARGVLSNPEIVVVGMNTAKVDWRCGAQSHDTEALAHNTGQDGEEGRSGSDGSLHFRSDCQERVVGERLEV